MFKKRSLLVVPVAAALLLSGCSNSSETAPESPSSNAPSATEQSSAPAQNAGSADALSAEQVKAVVDKVFAGKKDAMILDSDTIKSQAEAAGGNPYAGADIKPAKCQEYLNAQAQAGTDGVNVAMGMTMDQKSGAADILIVQGIEDAKKAEDALDVLTSGSFGGCDKFSITTQGTTIDASIKKVDISTDADVTMGMKIDMSINGKAAPGGSYQIQSTVGPNVIVVQHSGATTESEDAIFKDLADQVNQTVAEVKAN